MVVQVQSHRLSLLGYEQVPKLHLQRLDSVGKFQYRTSPIFVRGLGPSLESCLGCGDGTIEVALGCNWDLSQGHKSGWINAVASCLCRGSLAIDDLYEAFLELYLRVWLTVEMDGPSAVSRSWRHDILEMQYE